MPGAAVCFDAEVARVLAVAGVPVVLCGTDGAALGRAAWSLRGVGRVSAMVGDPASGPDLAAAVAMAAELYGTEPSVIASLEDAHRMIDPARVIAAPMG